MRYRYRLVGEQVLLAIVFLLSVFFLLRMELFWNVVRPVFHKQIINHYAGVYKIDPLLLAALIKVESNFTPWVLSHKGAIGLMQILPSTAEEMAKELGLTKVSIEDLKKPRLNIRLGVHYLNHLRQEFPGDLIAQLAAYNAGSSRVRGWKKDQERLRLDDITFAETHSFVARVLDTYEVLKSLQRIKYSLQGRPLNRLISSSQPRP